MLFRANATVEGSFGPIGKRGGEPSLSLGRGQLPATWISTWEPVAGWTVGATRRDYRPKSVNVRQAGRSILIATSRTPNARPRPAARGLRGKVRAQLVSNSQAVALGRRLRTAGLGAGLVVLVGLTTWAVASVSVWMAPAYLALMVLIFVTPLGRRPSKSAPEPGLEPIRVGDTESGQSLRADRAAGADDNRPAAELDSSLASDDVATDPSSSVPDSTGSAGAKPKRGRGRVRKAAKTAVEPAPDSSPITWIRVGPGKFIRADAAIQAIDPTEVAAVAAEAVPATHTADAVPAISISDDQAQVEGIAAEGVGPATDDPHSPAAPTASEAAPAVSPAGQDPLEPSAMTPGDLGMTVRSDDPVVGSVTEEYGITPSAFGQASRVSSAAEGLGLDGSGAAGEAEADLMSVVDPDVETTGRGDEPGRLWSQRRIPTGRTGRISRGVAGAISGADRASSRRLVRTPPRPRTSVWYPFAPNARLQQATRRAFGRIPHVQRALRPRSPPRR